MIQSEQSIKIDAAIEDVWSFTSDMGKWALFMPGCRSFDILDDRNSCWTLKVGVGALVRTVRVLVHIDRWEGPERVIFSFTLQGDPVKGNGSYVASQRSRNTTDLMLTLHIEGGGPMAPIWETMSRPLLPQMIRLFCEKLKSEIEQSVRSRNTAIKADSAEEPCSWRRFLDSCAKLLHR